MTERDPTRIELVQLVLGEDSSRNRRPWSLVRGLGELQILTRASYMALLLVPLIAGLWPTIVFTLTQFETRAVTASEQLSVVVERLEISTSDTPEVAAAAARVSEIAAPMEAWVAAHAQEDPRLPRVWVWLFFAALFAVFAHAIYQSAAPQIVRHASLHTHLYNSLDRAMQSDTAKAGLSRVDLEVTVKTALSQYVAASRKRTTLAWTAGLLYLTALILIVMITMDQAIQVIRSGRLY